MDDAAATRFDGMVFGPTSIEEDTEGDEPGDDS
jgi:hypothetical protein